MIPYPASFYRHTITIDRQAIGNDTTLGPTATDDGLPTTMAANVQDRPVHGNSVKARDERYGAVVQATPFNVFTPVDPQVQADDKVTFRGQKLIVISNATDRGGYGVAWVFPAEQIT